MSQDPTARRMKKLPPLPSFLDAGLYVLLFALIPSPFLLLSNEPVGVRAGLCLFLYGAYLIGHALRIGGELTRLSAHKAELAALRRKHEAEFKTYLEFVKTSSQPSKN